MTSIASNTVLTRPVATPIKPAPGVPPLPANPTALQKHVMFFDRNGDAKITVAETNEGLAALGFSRLKSWLGSWAINLGLAPKTNGGTSHTDIWVANIANTEHDSASGVLDAKGNFVPAAFDDMFKKFDVDLSNTLDASELAAMGKAHAQSKAGAFASGLEFNGLLTIGADGQSEVAGKLVPSIRRTRMQGLYDGTLFYEIAEALAKKVRL